MVSDDPTWVWESTMSALQNEDLFKQYTKKFSTVENIFIVISNNKIWSL